MVRQSWPSKEEGPEKWDSMTGKTKLRREQSHGIEPGKIRVGYHTLWPGQPGGSMEVPDEMKVSPTWIREVHRQSGRHRQAASIVIDSFRIYGNRSHCPNSCRKARRLRDPGDFQPLEGVDQGDMDKRDAIAARRRKWKLVDYQVLKDHKGEEEASPYL